MVQNTNPKRKRKPTAKPVEQLPSLINRNGTFATLTVVILTVLLAIGAFFLSYDALKTLAQASNILLAGVWPLIIDGFIVLATIAAFTLRDRKEVVWYPWSALVLFAVASIAGNAYHAKLSEPILEVPVIVAALVSAAPAISLLVSSHLLVIMMSTPKLIKKAKAKDLTEEEILLLASKIQNPPEAVEVTTDEQSRIIQDSVSRDNTTKQILANKSKIPSNQDSDLLSWVRQKIENSETLTGSDIAKYLSADPENPVSVRTGQRKLRTLREQYPDIDAYAEESSAA